MEARKLSELSVRELNGVVEDYPWFGAARKELFMRSGANREKFAEAALHVPSRRRLSEVLVERADCRDSNVPEVPMPQIVEEEPKEKPRVIVVGGDYFSPAEYEALKRKEEEEAFRKEAEQRKADEEMKARLEAEAKDKAEAEARERVQEEARRREIEEEARKAAVKVAEQEWARRERERENNRRIIEEKARADERRKMEAEARDRALAEERRRKEEEARVKAEAEKAELEKRREAEIPVELPMPDFGEDVCTETFAQIYEQQGYYDKAREIYSKLILAYPEKNTYFAALIKKMDKKIKEQENKNKKK